MKNDKMVSQQFLEPTQEAMDLLIKYSIFYAVADRLKDSLKENFQSIKKIPTQSELDLNEFCDRVLATPFYEPQVICNDLFLGVMEDDFSKNIQQKVLEYENGTVVFPDEVMNEIKVFGHDVNFGQIGIASSDNVKDDLILLLGFIIDNSYLLNAAVELAIKGMLNDYGKSKDLDYVKSNVELNEVEGLFDGSFEIKRHSAKREFLLLPMMDREALVEKYGSVEEVIAEFQNDLDHPDEDALYEDNYFRCFQSLDFELYYQIPTECASRVAVKIVANEIDKRFHELIDFPTAEEIIKQKCKQEAFLDKLSSITPTGKTLLSIFHEMLIGPEGQEKFEAENDPKKSKAMLKELMEKQNEVSKLIAEACVNYIGATVYVNDLLEHVESYDIALGEMLLDFSNDNVTCLLNNFAQIVMVEENYHFLMNIAIDSGIKNYVIKSGIDLESVVIN